MKRIASLIIALAMLLSVTAVFAEDDNAAAFKANLQNMLNRVDLNTKALTVETAGNTVASLQAKDGLADLSIPGVFELQFDGENLWVSANGQVYQLPVTELQAVIQELYGMFVPGSDVRSTAGAMLSLLMEKVIAPGITMDYETGAVTIHLTGEQMLQGLAEFGDEVVANPEYLQLVTVGNNWVQLFGALVNRNSYSYRGPAVATPAQLAEQWPALREQILNSKTDLVIDGSFTGSGNVVNILLTVNANGAEQLRLEGSMTVDGESTVTDFTFTAGTTVYTVQGKTTGNTTVATYTLTDNGRELLTATVNATVNGNAVTATVEGTVQGEAFTGSLNLDAAAGTFDAELNVPAQEVKVTASGTYAADSLKAKLNVTVKGSVTADLTLDAAKTDRGFTADLSGVVADATIAYNMSFDGVSGHYNMSVGSDEFSSSANYAFELVEGDFPHFNVETSTKSSYYNTVQGYSYDGAELRIWSDNQTITLRGAFVSPTEYQITGEMVASYSGSSHTSNLLLSAVLDDAGDDWTVTLTATVDGEAQGDPILLKYGAQTGFEPLADKVTQTLTKDAIMQMLFPAAAAVTAY